MIWHHEVPENIAKELQTNIEYGLSAEEASSRLKEFGHNRYHEKHTSHVWERFCKKMKSPSMVLILLAAIFMLCFNIITLYFGGTASLIEPILLLLLPPIGFLISALWQKQTTAKLHHITNAQTFNVTVIRDGEEIEISAADVVRGDILLLKAGMIIPADCRLITATDLFCDEYVITGEDVDIPKTADITLDGITPIPERANMIYAGCGVSRGSGTALVVSIGQSTEYALKLNDPNNQSSPLPGISKDIATLERLATLPVLILSVIITVIAVFHNLGGLRDVLSVVSPILTLAAVAIPSSLTVAAVIAMTMGMQHVVNRSADVRDLSVMDTLSCINVICADKTGTLTDDEKKPVCVYIDGLDEIEALTRMPSNKAQTLIRLATLCTASDTQLTGIDHHLLTNPTESAIIEYARDIGIERRILMEETPRLAEIPFDTERRCMSVVHLVGGRRVMITMGAPESVFSYCTTGSVEDAENANRQMADRALRVLAVAYKYVDDLSGDELDASQETDMIFAGLIALADQAREDSVKAIAQCAKGGITTVMMTGDNEITALAVAKQLGILHNESQLMTGDQLREMSYEELDGSIEQYRVFARITPEEKERIIRAWQKRGAVVAATGNCLADVPTLQRADIGCATGAADCDMTRNESDLTLYDNGFASLVDTIKHARGIYSNIRKALQYALTCSFSLIIAAFLTVLVYGEFVMTPTAMALYFIVGILCSLTVSYESGDSHALVEKPKKGLAKLIPAQACIDILWQGALSGICAFIAFDAGQTGTVNGTDNALTLSFGLTTAFVMLMLSRVWLVLTTHRCDPEGSRAANRVMMGVVPICLIITVLPVVIPPVGQVFGLTAIGVQNWLLAVILSLIPAICAIAVRFVRQMMTTVKHSDSL